MTTFEDVLCKAKSVAEAAGKKTTDLLEVTKLKMEAAEMEKDLANTLEGLGRLVYDSKKSGDDVNELVGECVTKIDEMTAKIAELRHKVDEYKNLIRCKACDTVNADDSCFCRKCGAKLD